MEEQEYIYAFIREIEFGMPKLKEIKEMLPIEIKEVTSGITSASFSDPYVIYLHCKRALTKTEREEIKEILNPGH